MIPVFSIFFRPDKADWTLMCVTEAPCLPQKSKQRLQWVARKLPSYDDDELLLTKKVANSLNVDYCCELQCVKGFLAKKKPFWRALSLQLLHVNAKRFLQPFESVILGVVELANIGELQMQMLNAVADAHD